ncbi:MAG: protein kinase [Deltaproteobacteria bacterium]|nr:protein kinase [Deltaproteobacteria bacterium]
MSDSFPVPFGRYQLVERLAVGGMAELFKARVVGAHGFQKPVVIKKILPHLAADAGFKAMFIDEANITARLDHPKIAQVLELGTIDDQLYIAMEFIDGPDVLAILRACAQKKQHMPARVAAHVAHEVLDALDYAHQARDEQGSPLAIVHRDISPSNVLVSRRGDVKLADFGIAHAVERQQKTQAGTLKGKYGYMSPEQVVGGELDGRSDLFSVGIILVEMLMGRRLFTAPSDLEVLLMVRDVRLERLEKYGSGIDPELRQIVLKALQRDPKNRYPSAGAFRDAIGEWLFVRRQRVMPADLGAFVDGMFGSEPIKVGQKGDQASPGDPARQGTLAGPATKASQIQAEEAARAAREVLSSRMVAPSGMASGTGREDRASASKTSKRLPTSISGEIPIVFEVTEGSAAASFRPTCQAPRASIDEESELLVLDTVDVIEILDDSSAGDPAPAPGPSSKISVDQEYLDMTAAVRSSAGDGAPTTQIPKAPESARAKGENPDEEGDLAKTPPIHVLYRMAVERATGLLVVEISAITKQIYFAGGTPEYVSSNVARELLGEYLLAQKVISQGELAMALAMMPHFGGKLGDTLVGLGLMKPLDVFRHLTRQVREKIIDVCTWHKGRFRFYRGRKNQNESFPLGLDAFEVLGAGATALGQEPIEQWSQPLMSKTPRATKHPRVVPEAFRLGSYPRDVYNRLDGRHSVRELVARYTSADDRLAFLRTLYLLVHTELAYFS